MEKKKISKIGCALLVGGKSTRMGKEKASLQWKGRTFLETICTVLEETDIFQEKTLSLGNHKFWVKEEWKNSRDYFEEKGPMGGIHAVLKDSHMEAVFFVSCDMPLIKKEFVKRICEELEDSLEGVAIITKDGKKHPLCGIYKTSLLPRIEEAIREGDYRLLKVLDDCNIRWITPKEEEEICLTNINTPKDYQDII